MIFFCYRWILAPPAVAEGEPNVHLPIPKLTRCSEQHCLLTNRRIESPLHSMRCGRCSGVFHLDALYELAHTTSTAEYKEHFRAQIPYIVTPTKELLESQSHEEWLCPLCLQEDTHVHTHK